MRLHYAGGRSNREIAQTVRVSPTTVADYLRRARRAGLTWPLADGTTERAVEAALFPPVPASRIKRPEPDWAAVHRQLGRSGVTLDPLWQEYRAQHPEGYQYSAFCLHYRAFARTLPITLRQSHAPGERLFLDSSGQTVAIIDAVTGEEHQAQIFVAVLGASNYPFVEATWTQGLADWIGSHVRCLEFLGGVPELLVPDYVPGHIIGDDDFRDAAEKREGPDMGHQPVIPPLRPSRLDIGVIAGAQHRDNHLGLPNFTGGAVDDRHGRTGVVHKHLLAGPMGLAHHHIGVCHPSTILLAEPGVLIALGMRGFVLFPQEPQGDARSA